MSLPDTIFIFIVALIIFGPKKLPEMAKQLGKLMGEFRRASNEFKFQIEEELRQAERPDPTKNLDAGPVIQPPAAQLPETARPSTAGTAEETGQDNLLPTVGDAAKEHPPVGDAPIATAPLGTETDRGTETTPLPREVGTTRG
ncbi:MAG: Sec-independent protein translocase subunit TatA/TatB [Acidobacteriaceae bacterium]